MSSRLFLPQGSILFPTEWAAPQVLVLGGRAPSASWLRTAVKNLSVTAVDHGLDACRGAGIRLERLIGDGDSADPANWSWAESQGIPIERYPAEKDDTDTQLAIAAAQQESSCLLLTGAFGGRFDHAYSTLFSASRADGHIVLADEQEMCLFLHANESVTVQFTQKPKAISLLPFTAEVTSVTLSGVHWPLRDAVLAQERPNAISNELEPPNDTVTLRIGTGILGLYACWINGPTLSRH